MHTIFSIGNVGETRLDNLVLRLSNGPLGDTVPTTGETRFRGNVQALFDSADVTIDANTTTPNWDGDHPDYDHVLWVMNQ